MVQIVQGARQYSTIDCTEFGVCYSSAGGLVEDWGGWVTALWVKGRGPLHLGRPGLVVVYGLRRSGKSALLEALAALHLEAGWRVVDLYGAPGEQLAWLLSPYVASDGFSVLLVGDGSAEIRCPHIEVVNERPENVTRSLVESHSITIIPHILFGSPDSYLAAAASVLLEITDTLSASTPVFIVVREAYTLAYGRLKLYGEKGRAKAPLILAANMARHSLTLVAADTQYTTSIDKMLRETADLTVYKRTHHNNLPRPVAYRITRQIEDLPANRAIAVQQTSLALLTFKKPQWHKEETIPPQRFIGETGCRIIRFQKT